MGFMLAAVPAIVSVGASLLGSIGTGAAATAGLTAASAGAAATLASTAGTVITGAAAAGSAFYNANIQHQNAIIAARERSQALVSGTQQESQLRMQAARVLGAQTAGYAAGNIDTSVGTPKAVAASSQLNASADAAIIRQQSEQQGYNFSVQAWNAENAAKMDTMEGFNAAAATPLNAGGSFLSGASSLIGRASQMQAAGVP